jgi:hypothetical protein
LTPVLLTTVGGVLLALGVVSRRPWGRWWSGGGALSEQCATLMAPALGLSMLLLGVVGLLPEGHWVGVLLSLVAVASLVACIWVIFSLPVPDGWLVSGSSILADRRRRRQERRTRRAVRRARRDA